MEKDDDDNERNNADSEQKINNFQCMLSMWKKLNLSDLLETKTIKNMQTKKRNKFKNNKKINHTRTTPTKHTHKHKI